MPVPTPQLTLCLLFTLTTTLTSLTFRNPNPVARSHHAKDTALQALPVTPAHRFYLFSIFSTLHTVLILLYPSPPRALCPHPANLNPALFTWSPQLRAVLAAMLAAAPLRLAAFRALGSNFTFHLTRPAKLVTTGVYARVQHPSYLPDAVLNTLALLLVWQADGVLGCWMPAGWVAWLVAWKSWGAVGFMVFYLVLLALRVRDEEELLRKTFGREWEEWHARTKRFIPFVI